MAFNVKKCKLLRFGKSEVKPSYTLGGEEIQVVQSEMNLGVIVDHRLTV